MPAIAHKAAPRTLGQPTPEGPRCLFCGADLVDEGPAFVEHVDSSPPCKSSYDEWLARLGEDRSGG